MENLEQKALQEGIIETPLGFRDITIALRDRTLEAIRKHDIIRNVWIQSEKKENHQGRIESVYYFKSGELGVHGRIFPFDEILNPRNYCDIIVQNWKDERDVNLDVNPYHDLYEGEELYIRVTDIIREGADPSFKLFNRIKGFVKNSGNGLYEKIHVGKALIVGVYEVKKVEKGLIVKTWPVKFLEDG